MDKEGIEWNNLFLLTPSFHYSNCDLPAIPSSVAGYCGGRVLSRRRGGRARRAGRSELKFVCLYTQRKKPGNHNSCKRRSLWLWNKALR